MPLKGDRPETRMEVRALELRVYFSVPVLLACLAGRAPEIHGVLCTRREILMCLNPLHYRVMLFATSQGNKSVPLQKYRSK